MIESCPRVVPGPAAQMPAGGRALFLDRDGVINIDHGYVCSPADTQWVDGIFELCAGAQRLGYRLIVVTNQAGVARGYYTEADLRAYTEWVHARFLENGIQLTATIYCPHHPSAGTGPLTRPCSCRKPAPGMLLEAKRRFDIDLAASALLGDKESDMEAGLAAGVGRLYRFTNAGAAVVHGKPVHRLNDVLGDLALIR